MNFFPNGMIPNNMEGFNLFNKINELENKIKKLEQRIISLESEFSKNYSEPDNSLYMI